MAELRKKMKGRDTRKEKCEVTLRVERKRETNKGKIDER